MSLQSLLQFSTPHLGVDLGIDLGTANTLVYGRREGILINEPSIVAINTRTREVEAVGRDAKQMLGRTPASIEAIRPLKEGVIANFQITETMLKHFFHRIRKARSLMGLRVIICVPSVTTPVERQAVRDSALRARARQVFVVEEPLAAAIGAGLPVMESQGSMIVDIGGGTTEVAVISGGGIVCSGSVRIAGDHMDQSIIDYMHRAHGLLIGENTAEKVKMDIGTALPLEPPRSVRVTGRDRLKGIPRTIEVSDSEIRTALSGPIQSIVNEVRTVLEKTPPEISGDIIDEGIVLTGGGALLQGFDQRLSEETAVPVKMARSPLFSVALGTGVLLQDDKLLEHVSLLYS